MYPPPHHQSHDIENMISVINHFPLGMLVTAKAGKPFVTHIPFIYNEITKRLVAHLDRSNPQLETLTENAEVTVVFKGPDTYISPSIYTTPQLPTWNYIIVHITGNIKLINDNETAKQTMVVMTEFLEGKDQKFILKQDDSRMERFVNYIQAFEIEITNWEGKFKLSQDKNAADFENAKHELIKNSGKDVSGFIEEIYKMK
ncbi:FMN-binding negative transcriptional regulator [Aequorivita lipolytica]|uniref:FMN-binding negative transcriptional regulator n=1 Tax=Aequorivita lipolytica TaxID=153267 RepID=A0A5C6YR39_9FLAO|nr:FMN-binding negative transcriptional regulator [Aequorivita lipolytica]TXD69913.1 FMN-binding negative transcriptional regulator [Aequorivita lipolytica]SRX50266.1 Protease synthase and sporulation protein PAI 2 [Aequorivita lipolytica]